jgi:hypothetical protein
LETQESDIITIDLWNDITFEFIVRVRVHDDESAIILKGHLLVEYLLDKIIEQKCKAPNKILDDSRTYSFSVKLQLVYSMGLLPDYLYENIVRINRLRNKLAHNLDFELDLNNMLVVNLKGETIKVRPKGKRYPERYYLRMLCFSTLSDLRNYMVRELHIDPHYKRQ